MCNVLSRCHTVSELGEAKFRCNMLSGIVNAVSISLWVRCLYGLGFGWVASIYK